MRCSRRGLVALIADITASPLLVSCARYEDGIGTGTIANTVVRYYRSIENRDCAAIKAELVPEWASTVDCDQLIQSWDGLTAADISYPEQTTRIKGDTATVVANIRRQPEQPGCSEGPLGDSAVTHQLVVADRTWRIASIVADCR